MLRNKRGKKGLSKELRARSNKKDEQQKVIHKLGSEYLYVDVKTEREIQADTNPGYT